MNPLEATPKRRTGDRRERAAIKKEVGARSRTVSHMIITQAYEKRKKVAPWVVLVNDRLTL